MILSYESINIINNTLFRTVLYIYILWIELLWSKRHVLILRYGLWKVLLKFTSIWCVGSRPDILYVLELLTQSGRSCKNARVKSLVFRRTYRFQESDKDESKFAQR